MKKKIEKIMDSKILLSFLIILLISLSIGAGTYAWFTWTSTDNPTVTLTIGKMVDVIFDSGPDINITNLSPTFNYTGGVSTTFTIRNTQTNHEYQLYEVMINVDEIDSELASESFKYVLMSGTMKLAEGSFDGVSDGDVINVISTSMPEGTSNYTMYFYLDSNIENDPEIMEKEFSGSIEVSSPETIGNVGVIADLFTPNSTVTNNGITYNVDTTNQLIKDPLGNIRYYGADPNNYILFNCDTYPDTDCETWRIIGLVDGKLKIIRGENIGIYVWDIDKELVFSNFNSGVNQWGPSIYTDGSTYSGADLMKLLNPGYENNEDLDDNMNLITINNSLYYNSDVGFCYEDEYDASSVFECDFTSSGVQGIKNANTRKKIAKSIFYTGAWDDESVFPDEILLKERGTTVISNPRDNVVRTTIWSGRVAIPNASDYGYAADLSLCINKTLTDYYDSTCTSNNWIRDIITDEGNEFAALLNPSGVSGIYDVDDDSAVYTGSSVAGTWTITPVLYIDPQVFMSGTGTSADPYVFTSWTPIDLDPITPITPPVINPTT